MENRIQIHKGGRFVLPARIRKALKIQVGDEFVVFVENETIRLIPLVQAINLAQRAVRKYAPPGVSLVDDLIQTRREEASHE